MKKILVAVTCIGILSSCSIFKKSEKKGCPTDGRNVGAEKLLSGDPKNKDVRAANKAKYRGKKSY